MQIYTELDVKRMFYLFVISSGVTMGNERPTSKSLCGKQTLILFSLFSNLAKISMTLALLSMLHEM